MNDGYAIECAFSDEEFASIGKLIWAFCVFEDELARAALWLWAKHESTPDAKNNDKAILNVVEGTIRARFKLFLRLAKLHFSPRDLPLLLHLEERFPNLELTRNHVCHGKWHRSSDSEISFRFLDRESIKNELVPEDFKLDAQEIRRCVGEVLAATAFISRAARTLKMDLANPFSAA